LGECRIAASIRGCPALAPCVVAHIFTPHIWMSHISNDTIVLLHPFEERWGAGVETHFQEI